MKIVFAGTPAFAVPSLRALCGAGFDVAAVLTQPDKPQGRKGIPAPSPVKQEAVARGIPVLQPDRLREHLRELGAVGADCMVTCAYGQILTQQALDLFARGVWNVHASLLPAYRGAAPIARAIMDGARVTGVTVMRTDVGLDTGDMFLKEEVAISPADTCGTLTETLSQVGARLIVEAMERVERGDIHLKKQGEGFVCGKVRRTQVDFSRTAGEVSALVRGLSPAPLAFGAADGAIINFLFAEPVAGYAESGAPCGTVVSANPKRGLVVACGEGAVRISRLQPAGGRIMTDKDFLNGKKLCEGTRFDQPVL